jgi:hypothetical protein
VCLHISFPTDFDEILYWEFQGIFVLIHIGAETENLDGSVGIATGYGLDDRMIDVRFPGGGPGNFSFRHHVQTGSGAYPASYPMGTRGSFPGDKAAEAWS